MTVNVDVAAVILAIAALIPAVVTAVLQIRLNRKVDRHARENTAGREQVKNEIVTAVQEARTGAPPPADGG